MSSNGCFSRAGSEQPPTSNGRSSRAKAWGCSCVRSSESRNLSANQIEFVNLVVDHLTHHGVMGASALYESPFTDLTPQGPDGLFTNDDVDELVAVLDRVRSAAETAPAAATG